MNTDKVPTVNTVRERPAEAGGLAAAVAALIVYAFGIDDPAMVVPLIVVVGAVPSVITFLVELARRRNGGAG